MKLLEKWLWYCLTQKAELVKQLKNWALIRTESVNGDNGITNLHPQVNHRLSLLMYKNKFGNFRNNSKRLN